MKVIRAYDFYNNDCTMDIQCEHCGNTHKDTSAYNDSYYRNQVVPLRFCPACGFNASGKTKVEMQEGKA